MRDKKEIVPGLERIAVIVDPDPMWKPVLARMESRLAELSGVRFTSWDVIDTFAGFRKRMEALQTEADAVALIGIFSFKYSHGAHREGSACYQPGPGKKARHPRENRPAFDCGGDRPVRVGEIDGWF